MISLTAKLSKDSIARMGVGHTCKEGMSRNKGASIRMYNFISEDEHQTRGNKLGMDRAVRSIKMLLAKYVTENADGKWTLCLQDVIDWYNKRQHRSLFTLEEGVDGSTKSKQKYWKRSVSGGVAQTIQFAQAT